MKRQTFLTKRLHTLRALTEAVTALKSLSAHHFRLCRQALPPARGYRGDMETIVNEVGVRQDADFVAPPGLLLMVSDLGLCSDYNTRLVQFAAQEYHKEAHCELYCVGKRPRSALARSGITPRRTYQAPTSVDGLPNLLLRLAQDLLDDFVQHTVGSLFAVSARFEGAGRFSPVRTPLLPVHATPSGEPLRLTPYQSYRRLAAVAVREYLYSTLYEILLDSLVAEHGMRLLAAESARQWLDETTEVVRRQLAAVRREATTQEVLDIVAGARPRLRNRH
jgi:F-type H+-transporting ATPase subunit gamma